MFENALKWLRKSWLGALISYFIILIGVYIAIWTVGEPIGIPDSFNNLPDFIANTRIFFHLLLSIIITAHIIAVLLVIELNFFKRNNSKIYGIKINSPAPGDEVDSPFQISGTFKIKPPKDSIRILEFSPISQLYWAKKDVIFDDINKTWYSTVHIGAVAGEKREVVVAYIGEDGKALLNYSEKVISETGQWCGIRALTTDIEECDRLRIKRKP